MLLTSSILVLLHLKIHHNLAILSTGFTVGIGCCIETLWKLICGEDATVAVRSYYRIPDEDNNVIGGDKYNGSGQMYLD